jgi:hypothetical protein
MSYLLKYKWVAIVVCSVGVLFVISMLSILDSNTESSQDMARATKVESLDQTDVIEMRKFAEEVCRGWPVPDLAEFLGVEPTIESVASFYSKNLPEETRTVVRKTCEKELRRSHRDKQR